LKTLHTKTSTKLIGLLAKLLSGLTVLGVGGIIVFAFLLWLGGPTMGEAVGLCVCGLLVIVNIGVFVLFLSALWILARGVFGVMRLKAGRPIDNPRSWLF
jgi:uncharacterized membrane protein